MTDDEADRCGPPFRVFRSPALPGFRFECRRLDQQPPERTVAIMYRHRGDVLTQAGVGVFKDGEWKNDKRKALQGDDLYWTAMVKE